MIKVGSIMTKDVLTIPPAAALLDAAKIMASKTISSLVVVEKQVPIAMISDADVVRGIISKKTKVKDVMSTDFQIISPFTKFSEINKILNEKKIKRFPVVDNGKLMGLVTETDLIQATRDFTRFHQIIQEIILGIFGLATAFFLFYFSPLGAMIFG